jgi:hypothetical protein
MSRLGRSEEQIAKVRAALQSGEYLRANGDRIKQLTADLKRELKAFKRGRAKFIGRIIFALVAGDVLRSALSEENRLRDLREMISAGNRFCATVKRTGVLARPIFERHSASAEVAGRQQRELLEQTSGLRRARKDALDAVAVYVRQLEAAVRTARTRERGQKRTADEDGFFRALRFLYRDDLGEDPVSTPGATFSNVVVLIRTYQTRRVPEDVSRIVRAAFSRS